LSMAFIPAMKDMNRRETIDKAPAEA